MGKFCEVCAKGSMSGHNVSHSNRKTNRIWAPNVQRVRVVVDGQAKRRRLDIERPVPESTGRLLVTALFPSPATRSQKREPLKRSLPASDIFFSM